MIRVLIISSVFLLSSPLLSQTIDWKYTYGGANNDKAIKIIETEDHGLAFLGHRNNGIDIAYLIKLDSDGIFQWDTEYSIGLYGFEPLDMIKTYDDGFFIVGERGDPGTGSDIFLIRTDNNGDTLWTKRYGGPNYDVATIALEASDSVLIAAGEINGEASLDYYSYGLSMEANGDSLETVLFGDGGYPPHNDIFINDVIELNDYTFFACGQRVNDSTGEYDIYAAVLDEDGTFLGDATYGNANEQGVMSCTQIDDGTILMGGYQVNSARPEFFLMNITTLGDSLWAVAVTDSLDNYIHDIITTDDGGYILCASTGNLDPLVSNHAGVMKYAYDHTPEWLLVVDSTYDITLPVNIISTQDGEYVLCGTVYNTADSETDMYAVKIDVGCCIGMTGNADGDDLDVSDISDLLFLIDYQSVPGSTAPPCLEEADVNGDGIIDVSDVLFLIDYQFVPGSPSPAPCPYSN